MFDTMVRTPLSYVIGIEVVQNSPLAILPRHTHSWSLMINVDELRRLFKQEGINIQLKEVRYCGIYSNYSRLLIIRR